MSVRSWQDTIQLKTYPLGPEDPNPPFQRQGASWATYPYPLQDDLLEGPGVTKDWVALHIENEYLHAIVLPELGGHLHSLYDKVTKREVFYRNHVVKYGLVAIRGAWISGGIEFNFPTGHTHTTVDKVSWEIGGDEKAAWISIGNVDRLTRMEWCVKLSLDRGQRRLRQKVWTFNNTRFKHRYWFWSNSAVPATRDLRMIYPARKASTGGRTVDFPIDNGVDISRYTAMSHAADIFAIDVKEDFFGCHYDESDFGLVHVADRRQVVGKKYFTWGTSDDGMAWVDLLTDDDGQYVEIQSGRFETQSIWEFFPSLEWIEWEEYWLPEHGMGGWTWANEDAVFEFGIEARRIRLGALTAATCRKARLALMHKGKTVWRRDLSLGPTKPFRTEIPLPRGCDAASPFTLTLTDLAKKREILRYEHPPKHAGKPKVAETGENAVQPPKPEEECTAEELCVRAHDMLRRHERPNARRLFEKALALEPGLTSAHLGLGVLDLRAGRYDQASGRLEKVVARDRDNADAWYYLGIARRERGEADAALDALWQGELRLGRASTPAFLAMFYEDEHEPFPPTALPPFIRHGAFGLRSEPEDAKRPPARQLAAFKHWARGDVELWLESAFNQFFDAAARTMELAIEHCPGADRYPMTHYALAYWYQEMGEKADAKTARKRARGCPLDYCFPSRLEELPILETAVATDPADWKARYLLGNLLAALDRSDEAMAQWREAVKLDDSFAVLHRNLAFGALRWEKKPEEAAEHYHHAIARNPNDFRYYLDLAALLLHDLKKPEDALALLQSAPAPIQEKWQVAARIAEVLLELRRYNEVLDVLGRHKFFPWEGARQMHVMHASCLIARGEIAATAGDHARALADFEAATEYPRNLSVGKPATPHDAQACWLAAREAAEVGDGEKRTRYLALAADEPHDGPCVADLYKIRALRDLGRLADASELEATLRTWAQKNLQNPHRQSAAKALLEGLAMM